MAPLTPIRLFCGYHFYQIAALQTRHSRKSQLLDWLRGNNQLTCQKQNVKQTDRGTSGSESNQACDLMSRFISLMQVANPSAPLLFVILALPISCSGPERLSEPFRERIDTRNFSKECNIRALISEQWCSRSSRLRLVCSRIRLFTQPWS